MAYPAVVLGRSVAMVSSAASLGYIESSQPNPAFSARLLYDMGQEEESKAILARLQDAAITKTDDVRTVLPFSFLTKKKADISPVSTAGALPTYFRNSLRNASFLSLQERFVYELFDRIK